MIYEKTQYFWNKIQQNLHSAVVSRNNTFFWLCSNLKGGVQKQVRVFTKRAVNWKVESPFKNSFQSVGRFFYPHYFS